MYMKRQTVTLWMVFVLLGVVASVIGLRASITPAEPTVPEKKIIASFADCAGAGYPIMESYPEQCTTPDGKHFVNEKQISVDDSISVGFLEGKVEIGPNCPVEREDMPCKTPPEAYTSRQVVVYSIDMKANQGRSKISTDGSYKVTLEPGEYLVRVEPAGIGPGEFVRVKIEEDKTTVQDLQVDTGIR